MKCKDCKYSHDHLPHHNGDCLIKLKLLIFNFDYDVKAEIKECKKYEKC